MRAALALLAVSNALATGLAACGDGGGPISKSEYEAKMGALVREASMSQVLRYESDDFASLPAFFRRLSTSLGDMASRTKAIEPPREVAADHAQIVDGFMKEAAIAGRFADELRGASVARMKVLLRRFDSSGFRAAYQEIDAASRAIEARGYRIRPNGGT